MKKTDQKKDQLFALLNGNHSGRENLIGGTALAKTLHISGNELRKKVNQLRGESKPIGSTHEGYFYATTAGEIYDTIRMLERIKKGVERAIQGLVRSLDDCQVSNQDLLQVPSCEKGGPNQIELCDPGGGDSHS